VKYLIGEIGIAILIAGLIGLFIGWMWSRFLSSRALVENRQVLITDIRKRDQEIDRLRYELRGFRESGGSSRESRIAREQVRTLKKTDTTAVLRVPPDQHKSGTASGKNVSTQGARGAGNKKPAGESSYITRGQLDNLARGDQNTLAEERVWCVKRW